MTDARSITPLVWRPDGKTVAFGSRDGNLHVYDLGSGKRWPNSKPSRGSFRS
ncbi:WD40 domain-containing protein [Gemmata massiliana]|uniref:WD40 domain-containing protein n=1 Tax=Gemmata massiliana TaxID=1210884 RepID=UPI0036F368C9